MNRDKLNECTYKHLKKDQIVWNLNGLSIPITKREEVLLKKRKSLIHKKREYKLNRVLNILKSSSFDETKLFLIKESIENYKGILPRLIEASAYLKLKRIKRFEVIINELMYEEFQIHLLSENISSLLWEGKKEKFFFVLDFYK